MPISLKTGGGGLPISAILPLNATQTVYTPEEGDVWLRSGTITDDLTTYPKATTTLAAFFDNFFSNSSEVTYADAVITDGTIFWVISTGRIAYKYDVTGTYTGTSSNVSTSISTIRGGTWDGTNFWLVDQSDGNVKQFDTDFNYTGTFFSTQGVSPTGIAWDGTYLYVGEDDVEDRNIYRYDSAGTYTNFSFPYNNETATLKDITVLDGFLWLMEVGGKTFKYNLDGEYTGDFFEVVATSNTTNPYGITSDSDSFWIGGNDNSVVSEFTSYAGIAFLAFDTDSGKPLYVKVA